jgi:hypothetical protein
MLAQADFPSLNTSLRQEFQRLLSVSLDWPKTAKIRGEESLSKGLLTVERVRQLLYERPNQKPWVFS